MAFKKPPLGKRGYDEEDVDAFLDELEQELVRLIEENASLRDQVHRAGPGSPGAASSTVTIRSELAGLAAQLEWMQAARARADEHARGVAAQLEQARTVPAGAGSSGMAQVVMMAQRTADEYLRDAERKSEELLVESRAEAEQIAGEAQLRAETMERDAHRDHTESINRVQSERAALLEEIAGLSQLAAGYQDALRTHVTQQLQELNSVTQLD